MHKRTFIAIKINPTEEIIRRIYYLQNQFKHENINWINPENLHLTLKFLGNTPIQQIDNIGESLSLKLQNQTQFRLSILNLGVFGSQYKPKVIWFGTDRHELLKHLAREIQHVMNDYSYYSDRQNFVPHLSIARIRKINDKKHFFNVINSIEEGSIHQELVRKITFYESILTKNGAIYEPLKEIELQS